MSTKTLCAICILYGHLINTAASLLWPPLCPGEMPYFLKRKPWLLGYFVCHCVFMPPMATLWYPGMYKY